MTRDLAEAAAFYLLHQGEDISWVAHDFKVDEGQLARICETYIDDPSKWMEYALEAVADYLEGL